MSNWAERIQKAKVRNVLLARTEFGPAKRAIFLPGWDTAANEGCFCVRTALETGLIDHGTEIVAVERDRAIAPLIHEFLVAQGFKVKMHTGNLHTLRVDGPVDFAFFDFLGSLDRSTALWMANYFQDQLTPNSSLAFTFSYAHRHNEFMHQCHEIFKTRFAQLSVSEQNALDIDDFNIVLHEMVLSTVFNHWQVGDATVEKYRDGMTMVGYRFNRFKPADESRNQISIYEILNIPVPKKGYRPSGQSSKKGQPNMTTDTKLDSIVRYLDSIPKQLSKPTAAELKAVEEHIEALKTILISNGLKADARSDRALKAWATRRGTTVDKRSQRAIKAWQTRRENGWVHPAHRAQ